MISPKEVYTTGEVAKICGVTLRTVVNWIQRGDLCSYKLPGKRGDNRVTHENLLIFFEENAFPLPEGFDDAKQEQRAGVILVVEDDPLMAKSIARALKTEGFDCLIAHDGFEAGTLFMERQPSLVTLDLNMPGLDGFSVLDLIKSKRAETKVLIISGEGNEALQRALDHGADKTLAKPFDNHELIAHVRALLN
jgi:excisionase family DNA binding protein